MSENLEEFPVQEKGREKEFLSELELRFVLFVVFWKESKGILFIAFLNEQLEWFLGGCNGSGRVVATV